MNKIVTGLFISSMVLGMAACGAEENAEGSEQELGGEMILATTTSTYDSGLLDALVPEYEDETGVDVKIISVGSGEALAMGEKGEADALLVHAPAEEEKLEEEDIVQNRQRVMHNDFVLLGPENDPAGVDGLSITDAFNEIEQEDAEFISRGDDSGTHFKELELWDEAGVEPDFSSYQESGQGMGDTLRIAAEKGGYALADRGTFLSLQDSLDGMAILVEGDETLQNIYHVMDVNPELSDQINNPAAEAFVEFFTADSTQETIQTFGEDKYGEPLFFPHLID